MTIIEPFDTFLALLTPETDRHEVQPEVEGSAARAHRSWSLTRCSAPSLRRCGDRGGGQNEVRIEAINFEHDSQVVVIKPRRVERALRMVRCLRHHLYFRVAAGVRPTLRRTGSRTGSGLVTADLRELPFANAGFDVVLSGLAIHNIKGNNERPKQSQGAQPYAVEHGQVGWRMWFGGPRVSASVVCATKPQWVILPMRCR